MNRSYSEMLSFSTFLDRYNYLKLDSTIGDETFGFDRYLNQRFYKSPQWIKLRNFIITRDNGFDLAAHDVPIFGRILVHHINPLRKADIEGTSDLLLDPENLVSVSHTTHNAIHYGDSSFIIPDYEERRPGDHILW